ncbi:MAG: lipid-A-disaccharide synthase [Halioglobus sp.]|jgi:lipid-A-disaccharide synthase
MVDSLRIGMVAGEASGDLLGARVIQALSARCNTLTVEGIGGAQMQEQGMHSLFPLERLSVMGLVEPLKRLPELLRMRGQLFRHFRDNPPDVFLGIDAPDFNLQLERKLRGSQVPVAHLVSPSVWAWRQGRLGKIGASVDTMLCLFPFETAIYERHGIDSRFVGHPLADELPMATNQAAAREALGLSGAGKILALLPGSRASEVQALAPLFLEVAHRLWLNDPTLSFVLPAASPEREVELREIMKNQQGISGPAITLLQGQAREAMAAAETVLLASGTASLEAALLKKPMVVAYRMGAVSWAILSRMVHSEHIALPNLLAGKRLVPELLQGAATPEALVSALQSLLYESEDGSGQQQALTEQFAVMHEQLKLNCAEQVADALLDLSQSLGINV